MARHCNVCQQSYPDELETCPHCAEAVDVAEAPPPVEDQADSVVVRLPGAVVDKAMSDSHSEVDLQLPDVPSMTKPMTGSHSEVDLQLPDIDPRPATGSHSEVDLQLPDTGSGSAIGAASRVNVSPPLQERPFSSTSELDFGLPEGAEGSGSVIPRGEDEAHGGQSVEQWSSLVGSEDVSLEATAPPAEFDSPSDADLLRFVREKEATPAGPGGPDSTVDLTARDPAGPPPSGLRLVSEALEDDFSGIILSGIGQRGPATPEAPPSDKAQPAAEAPSGLNLGKLGGDEGPGDSAINLGELPSSIGERPSGRDHIAEAVESGVDLLNVAPVEPTDEAGFTDASVEDLYPQDSAVDLGAPAALVEEESSHRPAPARRLHQPPISNFDQEESAQPAGHLAGTSTVPVARSRGAAGWLGGGVIGTLVGVAACVALWVAGVEPPASLRVGSKTSTSELRPAPQGQQPASQEQPAPSNLQSALADLQSGNFDRALPLLEAGGDEPDRLAARGEVRWLNYLKQQKTTNAPVNAADEPVKQALADLNKAGTPAALFWIGQIEETAGALDDARKAYNRGLKEYPDHRQRFQAALDRLEVRQSENQVGAHRMTPRDALADARVTALMLVALQANAKAGADAEEAGTLFWKAAAQAKAQDYAGAVKTIDQARELHDKNRFARLRKAQNPVSDPNEEIFLRSCAELKNYWTIVQKLNDGGYPVGPKQSAVASVDAVLRDRGEARNSLEAAKKQTQEAVEAERRKTSDALAASKTAVMDAEKKAVDLAGKLKQAQDKGLAAEEKEKQAADRLAGAEAKEKQTSERLAAADARAAELTQKLNQVGTAHSDADAKLKAVAKKLEDAKFLAPKATQDDVVKAVERAVTLAKSSDPQGQLAALKLEAQRYQDVLAERHTPQEMLSIWMPLLANGLGRDQAPLAMADAERVTRDAALKEDVRREAFAVRGLALRDLGRFDEARTALQQAASKTAPKNNPLVRAADDALRQLQAPTIYYLPKAESLQAAGQYDAALAILNDGVRAFPEDPGRLLALRALVKLDLAREQAKGTPSAATAADARKDADAAITAGAVEGHYAAGRVAEELGDWAAARRSYEKAVELKPENRYRLALARVLLRMVQDKPSASDSRSGSASALASVVLLIEQTEKARPSSAERQEAVRLADLILASATDELTRAQALAIKGQYAAALTAFAEGLRPRLTREEAVSLRDILANMPNVPAQREVTVAANPAEAGRRYEAGLRLYTAGRYPEAEKELADAVRFDGLDARYFYFLGLARLQQNKGTEAQADFEYAARLERQDRPDRVTVSAALERVQGPPRQVVNRFRP